jgi:hypothetical protein
MEFWFWILMHQQLGRKPPTPAESQKWFVEFTRDSIAWASDGFIREYAAFRGNFFSPPGTPDSVKQAMAQQTLPLFEKSLYAIRADLGHANKGLSDKTLLALWITDIDQPQIDVSAGSTAAQTGPQEPPSPTAEERTESESPSDTGQT